MCCDRVLWSSVVSLRWVVVTKVTGPGGECSDRPSFPLGLKLESPASPSRPLAFIVLAHPPSSPCTSLVTLSGPSHPVPVPTSLPGLSPPHPGPPFLSVCRIASRPFNASSSSRLSLAPRSPVLTSPSPSLVVSSRPPRSSRLALPGRLAPTCCRAFISPVILRCPCPLAAPCPLRSRPTLSIHHASPSLSLCRALPLSVLSSLPLASSLALPPRPSPSPLVHSPLLKTTTMKTTKMTTGKKTKTKTANDDEDTSTTARRS